MSLNDKIYDYESFAKKLLSVSNSYFYLTKEMFRYLENRWYPIVTYWNPSFGFLVIATEYLDVRVMIIYI